MIGDYLYELTARDAQADLLRLFFHNAFLFGLVTSIRLEYQVPNDRILRLDRAIIETQAGAGQSMTGWFFSMFFEQQSYVIKRFTHTSAANGALGSVFNVNLANDLDTSTEVHGPLYIPPNAIVRLDASFNLGFATNSADWSLFGQLLPRGNLSL